MTRAPAQATALPATTPGDFAPKDLVRAEHEAGTYTGRVTLARKNHDGRQVITLSADELAGQLITVMSDRCSLIARETPTADKNTGGENGLSGH